ncbi:MAG: response regulator [Saprospiraceae bacterium]|nr:response regulator [Saprospiraceae bacterium]
MKNYRIHITLLILIISFRSWGQHPYLKFNNIGVSEGLSHSYVKCMWQDELGFIWFGTLNGLNRYDGYSFKVYKYNLHDPGSLSNNQINHIHECKSGDLLIATAGGGVNLYSRQKDQFTNYRNNPNDKLSICSDFVTSVLEDQSGNIWIGSEGKGINVYDAALGQMKHYSSRSHSTLLDDFIQVMLEDHRGQIWIGTSHGGLLHFDHASRSFINHKLISEEILAQESKNIRAIFEDSRQRLWVGTNGAGIYFRNKDEDSFHNLSDDPNVNGRLESEVIYSIAEDNNGNIWIGTENGGLSVYSSSNEVVRTYKHDGKDENSLSTNSIHSLLKDQKGNIWIGSFNEGVDLVNIDAEKFIHYRPKSDPNSLNHDKVLTIYEGSDSMIWIGTDGGGLNRYDPVSDDFSFITHRSGDPLSLCGDYVLSICEMKNGELWVGTWGTGISVFDSNRKIVRQYKNSPANPASLSSNNVWVIHQDEQEKIWIGTHSGGLNLYDSSADEFVRYSYGQDNNSGTNNSKILSITADSRGYLWLGTDGGGLNRLNRETGVFEYFINEEGTNSISNNSVGFVHEDLHGNLWISTKNGLDYYLVDQDKFTNYSIEEGLTGNIVQGILEDEEGHLWISTNAGISKFDRFTSTFRNYTSADGMQPGEFKELAFCRSRSGRMYFGGNSGFSAFWPSKVTDLPFTPPLMITGFQIFNKEIAFSEDHLMETPTLRNISLTEELTLSSESTTFSIDFASLNYVTNEKKKYQYRLLGFDDDWRDIGNRHSSTFTNLDPGKYVFQVKGIDNEGTWNDDPREFRLTIRPPYWETWWFRLLMALLVLSGLAFIFYRRTRVVLRRQKALEIQVAMRTQELMISTEEEKKARMEAEKANTAKSVFLATMSHEIRTPMNGVIGMANLLMETPLTAEQRNYAETITTSADALLCVINDILDFSKIESGKMELTRDDFNLRTCIEEVLDVFAGQVSDKGLDLIYRIHDEVPANIIGDTMRLRQILINLINNAIKFTNRGEIFVGVRLANKLYGQKIELQFEVRDTGIGIPKGKVNKLFRAFSQVDSSITRKYGGSGLGLIISKRLVNMMGGEIGIESEEGVGSTFHFTIATQPGVESVSADKACEMTNLEGKKILIVDDNRTNLEILEAQLKGWKYEVVSTSSGNAALEQMIHSSFDLVITDMQMPEMDGIKLAKVIRQQNRDLPIIVLSSLSDASYKGHSNLFSAVLTKPVKHDQLCQEIYRHLKNPLLSVKVKQVELQKMSTDFADKFPSNIVIAEDNRINQMVIRKTLGRLGFDPVIVENGREVLDEVQQNPYDIILMDIQMPEMDGLEATRQIRKIMGKHPVIIAMTANAMQSDKEECLAAGMDDYISKPIKVEDLKEKLEKWCSVAKVQV